MSKNQPRRTTRQVLEDVMAIEEYFEGYNFERCDFERHDFKKCYFAGDSQWNYAIKYFKSCIYLWEKLPVTEFERGQFGARSWTLIFSQMAKNQSQQYLQLCLHAYEFYRLAGWRDLLGRVISILVDEDIPINDVLWFQERCRSRRWFGLDIKLSVCQVNSIPKNNLCLEDILMQYGACNLEEVKDIDDFATALAIFIIIGADSSFLSEFVSSWLHVIANLSTDATYYQLLPFAYAIISNPMVFEGLTISQAVLLTDILNDAKDPENNTTNTSTILISNVAELGQLKSAWQLVFCSFDKQILSECIQICKTRTSSLTFNGSFKLGSRFLEEVVCKEKKFDLDCPLVRVVVFDTNVVFDMAEEIIHLLENEDSSSSAPIDNWCFVLPLTVIQELQSMSMLSGPKGSRAGIVLELMLASRVSFLTLDGHLEILPTLKPIRRHSRSSMVTCNDDAILSAIHDLSKTRASITLVTLDINLMLKGSAWKIKCLQWDEFIKEFLPYRELE